MPEFILDYGSSDGARAFKELDYFTRGYIEAMFFTSTGTADDEDLEDATVGDLAPETLEKIKADCAAFQADHAAELEEAYGKPYGRRGEEYDSEAAGRDFWYSRNGHGVGFWDRGLGEIGDRLHNLAKHREINLYQGEDGRLYLG